MRDLLDMETWPRLAQLVVWGRAHKIFRGQMASSLLRDSNRASLRLGQVSRPQRHSVAGHRLDWARRQQRGVDYPYFLRNGSISRICTFAFTQSKIAIPTPERHSIN